MTDVSRRETRAYFGHHKCASTWIMQILDQIAVETGMRHLVVVDDLTPQRSGPLRDRATLTESETEFERSALRAHVDATRADLVSCLTADRAQAECLRAFRAVHVVRDPRDIVVSAYFSHRNSHPTHNVPHMESHRTDLREASQEEGLFLEMEFSSHELFELADWDYADESILELKMEDITARPYESFISIFRHLELLPDHEPVTAREQVAAWSSRLANRLSRRPALGWLRRDLPVTADLLLGTVYARRFEAQTGGRRAGREDVASHYRKGTAGDWLSHFSAEHAEAFDRDFGDLLISLGYEADHSWVDQVGVRT